MGRVEKSIVIEVSPEQVWGMLALDRFAEWQVGHMPTNSIRFTSEVHIPEDKYRVGATAFSSDQPKISCFLLRIILHKQLSLSFIIYVMLFVNSLAIIKDQFLMHLQTLAKNEKENIRSS